MNKTNLIILILLGAVLFVVGGGLGIIYQTQKNAPQAETVNMAKQALEAVKILSSGAIPSIGVSGTVVAIDGRNITFSYGKNSTEKLTFEVQESVPISVVSQESPESLPEIESASLGDIKTGDKIGFRLEVEPEGQIKIIEISISRLTY
ncbi:MAG: hypothetical protein Q8Q48_02950 [Candidatus Staskawiczbacteria bacterium]|nr:hypothetical protein [Candidatus Staskawiczbacteria bacterium]